MTIRTTRKDLRPNNPVATVLGPYAEYCRRMASGYEMRPPSAEESPERTAGRIEGLRQAAGILEQGRAIALDVNAEELLAQAAALEAANDTLARTSLIAADLATKMAAAMGKAATPPAVPATTFRGLEMPRSSLEMAHHGLLGVSDSIGSPRLPPRTFSAGPAGRLTDSATTPPILSDLDRCSSAILCVLHARYPAPTPRATLAFLAGYSVESGGYSSTLGELRGRDFIEDVDSGIVIAAQGQLLAQVWYLRDVVAHWVKKLDRCEGIIVQALMRHPGGIERSALAEETGYSPDSGGFSSALGRLRGLEILEKHGKPKATEHFMTAVRWAAGQTKEAR